MIGQLLTLAQTAAANPADNAGWITLLASAIVTGLAGVAGVLWKLGTNVGSFLGPHLSSAFESYTTTLGKMDATMDQLAASGKEQSVATQAIASGLQEIKVEQLRHIGLLSDLHEKVCKNKP